MISDTGHRIKLEKAAFAEEDKHGFGKGDMHARLKLERWDAHIIQLIPAPPGLIIRHVYDGVSDDCPVLAIGLRRDGLSCYMLGDEYGTGPSPVEGFPRSVLLNGVEIFYR